MLIRLTAPDGSIEEFKPDDITNIRNAPDGMYAPGTKSVVRCDGQDYAVKETRAEIDAILAKVRE